MARLLKQSEAKRLGLPGRTSLEPVSGEIGSRVTFRIAEIPVPKAGDKPRGPHLHREFEECIYVLSGEGTTLAESGEIADQAGRHRPHPAGREAHDAQHRERAARAAVLLPGSGRHARGPTEFPSF